MPETASGARYRCGATGWARAAEAPEGRPRRCRRATARWPGRARQGGVDKPFRPDHAPFGGYL